MRRLTVGVVVCGLIVVWLSSCVLLVAERALGPGLFDTYPPLPSELHGYRTLAGVAVIVSAVAIGFLAILRRLRAEEPVEGPRCRHCDYNLTGNVSGVCPECGEKVDVQPGSRG